MIFTWAYPPWADDNEFLLHVIKTPLLIHVIYCSSFINNRYLEACDSPWFLWSIGFKHPLALLHHKGPSAPSLMLALLQCMVHPSQVLANPSSTSHHDSHVSLYPPLSHSWYSSSCCIFMLMFDCHFMYWSEMIIKPMTTKLAFFLSSMSLLNLTLRCVAYNLCDWISTYQHMTWHISFRPIFSLSYGIHDIHLEFPYTRHVLI